MENKIFLLSLITIILLSSISFAAGERFFKGIVHVNGSLAPNGTIVEAFVPANASIPVSSVTIGAGLLAGLDSGKYVIAFEASEGDRVSFKVNGLALIAANGTSNVTQNITSQTVYDNFNLSINKSANGAACTFAVGCTGGFCVHNICRAASTFCGDSFCDTGESCSSDDSACSSGQACTNGCVATAAAAAGGGGGGGGGGGPSLPSVTETINKITANAPTAVNITETKLPVSEIELTTNIAATNVQVTIKEVSQPSGVSVAISSDVGKVYKYIEITTSGVDNTQLTKVKIKFKVPKTWFTTNSIDPSSIALKKLVGTTWTSLPTTKVSEDATNVYYETETTGFSTFAITGMKTTVPPVFAVCGNNILESGEECDEQQLADQTCVTKGFTGGTLKCTSCRFDTSECTGAPPERPPEKPPEEKPPELPGIPAEIYIGMALFAFILILYYYWIHKKGKTTSISA